MNFFIIAKLLGLLLVTLGFSMTPSLAWAVYFRDASRLPLLFALLTTIGTGGALFFAGRLRPQPLFRREAIAVVGLGWLLCALAGALPFYFGSAFPSLIDCYFESMSGFTTTGASVLTDFAALPKGLHFWRCFTHWLGGMGIIVLFVAILPFLGAGGRTLLQSETPGPVSEALTPRIKETAAVLWKLYCFFTVLETALLMAVGMSFFDALCHTFATLATGGFSTHPESVGGFRSLPVEIILIVFMVIAGTNFSLFYGILRGNRRGFFRDPEWRAYVGVMGVGILAVALLLHVFSPLHPHAGAALRQAAFQVVSLMTTTGFTTANFDAWPPVTKCILLALMFVGGCAGSTGGGIKVVRWLILFKVGWRQLERVYSPRTVRKVRLGGKAVTDELKVATLTFFFIWMVVFCLGTIAVALFESHRFGGIDRDLLTAATAVAATLNNIGPGLGAVGAVENYAFFSPITKLALTFFMVLGRLELYTILVLFAPRFWESR